MTIKMLKRLSFTPDPSAPAQLLPPPLYASGSQSPRRRSIDELSNSDERPVHAPNTPAFQYSPSAGSVSTSAYPFPSTPYQQPQPPQTSPRLLMMQSSSAQPLPRVDRPTLHRSLAALSALLVAFDDLRDAVSKTAKAERKLAKAMKDVAASFPVPPSSTNASDAEQGSRIIVSALTSALSMMDTLSEATSKLSKQAQKEYETANDCSAKFFKSVAKAEARFDETTAQLEQKMQKATLAYERNLPKTRTLDPVSAALDHDKYMTAIASLSSQVSMTQNQHAEAMAVKREVAVKEVARCLSDLVQASWRNKVDATRMAAPKVGDTIMKGVWCLGDMPSSTYGAFDASIDDNNGALASEPVSSLAQTTSVKGPRPLPSFTPSTVQVADESHPAVRSALIQQTRSLEESVPAARPTLPTRATDPPKLAQMVWTENQSSDTRESYSHSAPGPVEPVALQRSDTTASELSFVAKMREKYNADKVAARAASASQTASERTTNDSESATTASSIATGSVIDRSTARPPLSPVTTSPLVRSDSRVRALAQQWSHNTQPTPLVPSTLSSPKSPRCSTRPMHKHSVSMQTLPAHATGNAQLSLPSLANEFGQRSSSPVRPVRTAPSPIPTRPSHVSSLAAAYDDSDHAVETPATTTSNIIHADICNCIDCAIKKLSQ